MKSSVVWLFVLVFSQNVVAQDLIERTKLGLSCQSTEEPNRISKNFDNSKSIEAFELFDFDNKSLTKDNDHISLDVSTKTLSELKSKRPTSFSLSIPVSDDRSFIVNLFKVRMHAEGSMIITPTDTLNVSIKNLFYRGVINDDHGSIVTLAVINDEVFISVNDIHGTYRVTPKTSSKTYQLSRDKSRDEREYSCGTNDEHHLGSTELYPVDNTKSATNEKALSDDVRIYVVCDYQLYKDLGSSITQTESYVNLLFNEINALYANESINMVVSDIFVYTSTDPYASNGYNTPQTLQDFGGNTSHTFNGDIASLLQGGAYAGGCSLSGIAWVDVLCQKVPNSSYGPYNITWGLGDCSITPGASTYSQALDVSIVAHEIGHNLGSPHTHSCCWGTSQNKAIDNCVTTVSCTSGSASNCGLVPNLPASDRKTLMSYCGNSTPFSNGFGTLPGNLIRNRVTAANCLTSGGSAPDCTNTNKTYNQQSIPNGTEVYADNQISILNNVSVGSNSNIMLSAENSLTVDGHFTINAGANVEIITQDCK